MNKIKTIIIIAICILILLVINKHFIYAKYNVKQDINIEKVGDTVINHKDTKEYLTYNDIKIRNDFKNYVYEEDENTYVLYNKEDDIVNMFSIFEVDTLINAFIEYDNAVLSTKTLTKYLNDNNINNDMDLMEHISNYKKDINFFSSNKDIRINYYLNNFTKDILPFVTEYKTISGDYEGCILYNLNYEEDVAIDIMLFYKNRRFVLSFIGEEFEENKIIDLIGTVVLNEEK